MPYRNINELPDRVKSVLPKGGQRLWMNSYNYADRNKDRFPDENARAQYAWGVVKKVYRKDEETGKWVKASLAADEFIFKDPKTPEEMAKHFFSISDEEWETLSAEEKKAYIDHIPVKLSVKYSSPLFTAGSPFAWQKVGDILKISGTLIAEGTWTGLDGQTVYYPRAIFPDAAPNILSAAIKRGHEMDEDAVVGFVSASKFADDRIDIEGMIFEPQTIQDIQEKKLTGLSMEADVEADYDDDKECYIAQSIDLLKATLVENPACDPCRIGAATNVKLMGQKEKEKRKMTTEVEYMLLYAKPTKDEFFETVESKLKDAGVEDAVVSKVMSVLRGSVKVPYPYPSPGRTEEPAPEKELADLQKDVDDLKSQLEEKERTLKEKTDILTAKETELSEKTDKVNTLSKKIEDRDKADIAQILEKIKEVDKDFNEKELLEDVACLETQKSLLSKYLGTMVKLAKKTSLSVNAGSVTEEKVKEVLLTMGIPDVKKFIEG